jgi:hypothetical protein
MDKYEQKAIDWFNKNGIIKSNNEYFDSEYELEQLLCFYKRENHLILFEMTEDNEKTYITYFFAIMLGVGKKYVGVNLVTDEIKIY